MYLITMPLLLLFNMAAGFSPTFAGLLICRLIAGTCASTGITLASATIADMFAPGNARRYAIYSYYSMPWLGAVLG
jgi:MFS family permease